MSTIEILLMHFAPSGVDCPTFNVIGGLLNVQVPFSFLPLSLRVSRANYPLY